MKNPHFKMKNVSGLFVCVVLLVLFILFILLFLLIKHSSFTQVGDYLQELSQQKYTDIIPFRLLCDERGKVIPVIALTAFLGLPEHVNRFREYIANGIKVIGYTSYKSFPKPISDGTVDNQSLDDKFKYTQEIKNWVCCFKNPTDYTFTKNNNLLEMSESDFIDASPKDTPKKYDFIYSCLEDDKDACPLNGWNAVNRNFKLALKCFPIMVNDFNLKILVVGRLNCGLEKLYPDNIEVVGFLQYNEFQERLRQSRYLFIPNVYDASPRVITEALSKDIPVLMNRNILCGSKYINEHTGEFFTDEHDFKDQLNKLLNKQMHPIKWWAQNYSKEKSGTKFRNFLLQCYPDMPELIHSNQVYFR